MEACRGVLAWSPPLPRLPAISRRQSFRTRKCHVHACDQRPSSVRDSSAAETIEESARAAATATVLLRRAVDTCNSRDIRPKAGTVVSALAQLEREQKRFRTKTNIDDLAGQWQLTVTGKLKKASLLERPIYFPVPAFQTFIPQDATSGVFDNGIFVLGCSLRFRGPYRWVQQANRLEFTFSTLSFTVGPFGPYVFKDIDKEGSTLTGRTAKTLPFFTFFLARSGVAAARGRGGGLALYRRVKQGSEV